MGILGRTWRPLLVALLLAELVVLTVPIAAGLCIYALVGGFASEEGETLEAWDIFLSAGIPVLLSLYLLQGVVGSLAATLAEQDERGTRVTVRRLLRASLPRIPGTVGAYLLTAFLFPLLVSPLAPLVAWPWVLYSLAPSVTAHEEVGMFRALRRASKLVKGVWWQVFVAMAFAALIGFGADMLMGFLVPADWVVSAADDGFGGVGEDLRFLGALVVGITGFVCVLMFQTALIHLVGAQLYTPLRDRHDTLATHPAPAAVPPPR
ncbi:hypothetical protein [Streptomyces netropsis]|uniref:Glycerophosphoryl diester phosphodiesterase membrane domain-containing protein n=1 Tax=Streptomyces netropsis TaxID=55404 RepID=A0A7W7PD18_STRNE|nr:hypothetical protein [Streptomyces netropsis]MBB4885559.1 hypothetical protein [Streptomyces netropsis]